MPQPTLSDPSDGRLRGANIDHIEWGDLAKHLARSAKTCRIGRCAQDRMILSEHDRSLAAQFEKARAPIANTADNFVNSLLSALRQELLAFLFGIVHSARYGS
jgi:hypothetical protein